MNRRAYILYTLIIITHFFTACLSAYPSADISFLVADLKYNKEQGVKICEIQLARDSKFKGSTFIHDDGFYIADRFYEVISQYITTGWISHSDICDKQIPVKFKENGWTLFRNTRELKYNTSFKEKTLLPLYDPSHLLSYNGALYARTSRVKSVQQYIGKDHGILVIDNGVRQHCAGKDVVSEFFVDDVHLQHLRPTSKIYPKKYSKTLANTIINDIDSEIFVIKPLHSSKGNGVIIVHKNDLKKTLKCILKDDLKARKHKDKAYRYWPNDSKKTFLIEGFVGSDPVFPLHLGSKPYDATMRVVFALAHDKQESKIFFVDKYWKLPKYSLDNQKSLNDLHKSCGDLPYFLSVDSQTSEAVEEQLTETMKILYEKMLNTPNL